MMELLISIYGELIATIGLGLAAIPFLKNQRALTKCSLRNIKNGSFRKAALYPYQAVGLALNFGTSRQYAPSSEVVS